MAVYDWLIEQNSSPKIEAAVGDAISYVLDGSRTRRFDLLDPRVDSDERSSVGTKLQYHIIEHLGLEKVPPLDTFVADVPVELKATVGAKGSWMIPREGQCEITLLTRIDLRARRFTSRLMRTHKAWLTSGAGNQDKKRNTLKRAVDLYSLEIVPWTVLPDEPLRLLDPKQAAEVFGKDGLEKRIAALFGFLPNLCIPRSTLITVGAGLDDPLRRVRESRVRTLREHGLVILTGSWKRDRVLATALDVKLAEGEWIALPRDSFVAPIDVELVVSAAPNR